MATVRSNTGSARIDKSSTVDIGGMRVSLPVAETLGAITRNANGIYEDVGGASAPGLGQQLEQEAQAQQQEAAYVPELFDPATEAQWAAEIAPLPQFSFDSAAALAAVAVTDADSYDTWDSLSIRLAKDAGIEPDQAAELVEMGYRNYEGQTAKAIATVGVDSADKKNFYSWLQETKPAELTKATQQLIGIRQTSQFKALAVQYLTEKHTAQLPEWRARGFTNSTVDRKTGALLVGMPGRGLVDARELLNK